MRTTTKPRPAVETKTVVLQLATPKGLLDLYKFEHSGEVIRRKKIDTVIGVKHPGIIIGIDKYNTIWVAHNHYKNGKPTIDPLHEYLDGEEGEDDNRKVLYSSDKIVQRAIDEVFAGKYYSWVNYNCQTFVNLIVQSEHKSETMDDLSKDAMIGGAVLALLGLAFRSPALVGTGMVIAGVGAGVKIYSRMK